MVRFEYISDVEEDCLTITDNEDELRTSFDSEIVLYPLEDAQVVVDKLNYYDALIKELRGHLEYYGWTEKDFRAILEDVEANL